MATRSMINAAGAVLVAASALAATAAPAAADSFSVGIRIGEPHPQRWAYAPWPVYRWMPPRVVYRPAPVEVCGPVWKTRRFVDARGRVYKVVRVRERECRWVAR